jgi:hypothetical protein
MAPVTAQLMMTFAIGYFLQGLTGQCLAKSSLPEAPGVGQMDHRPGVRVVV